MKDNISDMITRIRNGQKAHLFEVDLFWPTPKVCIKILDILKTEGFIRGYTNKIINNKKVISVMLKYSEINEPSIKKIERISTSGKRIFVKSKSFWKINTGQGVYIISTPMGIQTDSTNRFLNLGGEVLFYIE
jgi:small subunit ribosomal protein S8